MVMCELDYEMNMHSYGYFPKISQNADLQESNQRIV